MSASAPTNDSAAPVLSVLVHVSGRVQGVFFRASARHEAQRLQLSGYAKNLADGSVEVLAQGGRAEMEALLVWLQRGPSRARVERVTSRWLQAPQQYGFEVL